MKRITDPVHGSIHLTALEADIVATKAFQRLHGVRQLGLAYYVFPSANYSRFSHSLGACHNASRMIQAIQQNAGPAAASVIKQFEEALRIGALLHDLGHYPFSHATEHEVENFYSESQFLQPPGEENGNGAASHLEISGPMPNLEKWKDHEGLGSFILKVDPEINEVLSRHGKTAEEIVRILEKSDPTNTLVEIISSDLDCDRLDYLKRTAHHTGLPYGSVDTDFLISQATLDSSGAFAYTAKAARAADHLLVSRYYDYLQVPFNKTVAALEWSLRTAIKEALVRGHLNCTLSDIESRISRGTWSDFDDNYFVTVFRDLYRGGEVDAVIRSHLAAVLERKPAKTAFDFQKLVRRDEVYSIKHIAATAKSLITSFAARKGLESSRFQVWDLKVDFANYQAAADVTEAGAVKVIDRNGLNSTLLCKYPEALFSQLINFSHRGFRVFYLPSEKATLVETQAILDDLKEVLSLALQ